MTIYDSYNVPLAIPHEDVGEQKLAYSVEDNWSRLFALAKKYHTLAGMCVSRATDPLTDMAAFMLHQSVEVACRAIIRDS